MRTFASMVELASLAKLYLHALMFVQSKYSFSGMLNNSAVRKVGYKLAWI